MELHVADSAREAKLDAFARQADIAAVTRRLSAGEVRDLAPVLRPECGTRVLAGRSQFQGRLLIGRVPCES